MIQEAVLNYIDHLEDPAYFASLLGASETRDLIDVLLDLLRSGDHKQVGSTCLFIRDLILIAPKHNLGIPFRDAFFRSPLVPALEHLVLADNHLIRRHAIYTLGKTGSTGSVGALHHAFDVLRENDPLILPCLIGEIWWLEERKSWSLIDTMMTSQRYTTRWAALGTLTSWSGDGELQDIKQRCYASLRVDEHPLIRAEAEYENQQLMFEQRLLELTRTEKKKQRREIERYKPVVSFADIEVWFGNYLHANHLNNYVIDDLDRFITIDTVQIIRNREEHQQALQDFPD